MLEVVSDRTASIRRSDILAVLHVSGRAPLLPYVLAHHRKLGVRHFLVIDAASTSEADLDLLTDAPDCSLWRLPAEPRVVDVHHALNHLRHRYACGAWCLSLTADSLLVYPHCETRKLPDLVEFLASEGRETLYAVALDMYGTHADAAEGYQPGTDPLALASYFDATGYVQQPDASYGDTRIQGGPRRRIHARHDPASAPPIDAIPLVRWRKDYNYLEGTRLLAPKRLNRPHARWHLSPTGCLLRFSWLDPDTARTLVDAAHPTPIYDELVAFSDSVQLVRLGLMSQGQWF